MLHNTKTDDERSGASESVNDVITLNAVLWLIWGWHLMLALVIYAVAEGSGNV